VSIVSRWMWSDAVVVAESGTTSVLAYRMGLLASTHDRTIDSPPNREIQLPFLDQEGPTYMV